MPRVSEPVVPPEVVPGFGARSDTPRTDAFIDAMPVIPMRNPEETAHAIREILIGWAEFSRGLERELARKVWPH